MLNLVLFLVAFSLIIFLGTLAVAGWFFITRGSTEILPDGRKLRKGKIFRSWYFFWMQERPKKSKIYYTGAQLKALANQFKHYFPGMQIHEASVDIPAFKQNQGILQKIQEEHGVHFMFKGICDKGLEEKDSTGSYSIYREFVNYRFPEWVRHPLAQCATCFSSIYGSLFYWGVNLFFYQDLYSWTRLPILAALFFWVSFCISLAVTVTAVAKKYN